MLRAWPGKENNMSICSQEMYDLVRELIKWIYNNNSKECEIYAIKVVQKSYSSVHRYFVSTQKKAYDGHWEYNDK